MFLPSGRVHALGAGLVIFEIQQNSDTTYRVFDWHRKGLDGKPRELHVRESLQSINFNDFEPSLVQPAVRGGSVHVATLIRDPLFTVEMARIDPGQQLQLSSKRMHIAGLVCGDLLIQSAQGQVRLSSGQFCLVPASLSEVVLDAHSASTCLMVQAGSPDAL
jgi:mannose-6-phosphate isomerase